MPRVVRSVRYSKGKNSENHYREQLMLYMPWRNEDLVYGCQTFGQVKHAIFKNRCQYEFHSDMLDKAAKDNNIHYIIYINESLYNIH